MPPPGKGRPLACTRCHRGEAQARDKEAAHKGLVPNPSALDVAERTCGTCHQGWPQRVRLSPMATAAGIIAQSRYLWGAQADPEPRFGIRGAPGLLPLPRPDQTGRPVDDLLRRRCLRCHLWRPGVDLAGAGRSAGCAACHRPYDEQGRPPRGHGLTKKIPVRQCLTCHAGCGAGAEYVGRIPRDAHYSARFLATDRERPRLWQGRSWRPMQPDLHYAAGMACIDCHPRPEVMGDGRLRPAALLHVGLRCTTCHGRPGREPETARTTHGVELKHVLRLGGGLVLMGKLDGKARRIPALAGGDQAPVAHRVPQHARLACHACHSATNPAAWGTQVIRETRPLVGRWRAIAAQGDPQVWRWLTRPLPRPPWLPLPPLSRDYLDGSRGIGLWILAPFFRRFTWRLYGRGPDGRVMLLAPRFQWVVTLLDDSGQVVRDAAIPRTADGRPGLGLTPWHPHTTSRATVSCADCHGSARAAGLGLTFWRQSWGEPGRAGDEAPDLAPPLWQAAAEGLPQGLDWLRVVDRQGRPQQVLLVPGARPFSQEELRRLLQPGKDYTRWLLMALEEEWPWAAERR